MSKLATSIAVQTIEYIRRHKLERQYRDDPKKITALIRNIVTSPLLIDARDIDTATNEVANFLDLCYKA